MNLCEAFKPNKHSRDLRSHCTISVTPCPYDGDLDQCPNGPIVGTVKELILDKIKNTLTPEDANLIHYCRKFGHGQLTVELQKGRPAFIEKVHERIKLFEGSIK